ncbi:hypothetical protein CPIN17262_1332 [Campylobacter pinnipediorum subsp. pinnipediorum]|uniref:hypothetical protein n=1 Tax=Campylobacter pinnipediorum TaxID=1965231 RepID=UPI0009954F01|nr:hypothetical protein [Campylobacter pinnipediorum]AQW84999.1 hypothetical protein CPIN17262_1332 [Campylobacter pinnipediorum subsp. pinnipediorum]
MYLLTLRQNGNETMLGLFETLESGREFVKKLPSYKYFIKDGFEYETLDYKAFSEYFEVEYKTNILPFSKFMFKDESEIYIEWKELPSLDKSLNKIVGEATLVDAYLVNNDEVKDYITKRESLYLKAKQILEKMGFEVSRAYKGSEDGEAIIFKKQDTDEWRFLTHLDPIFVRECPCDESDITNYIQNMI